MYKHATHMTFKSQCQLCRNINNQNWHTTTDACLSIQGRPTCIAKCRLYCPNMNEQTHPYTYYKDFGSGCTIEGTITLWLFIVQLLEFYRQHYM